MKLIEILPTVPPGAGVLRHCWDIWVHRTVRDISFVFAGIDAVGDLFSLTSVLFQPTLDILGMNIYGTELVLWLGCLSVAGITTFFRRSGRSGQRTSLDMAKFLPWVQCLLVLYTQSRYLLLCTTCLRQLPSFVQPLAKRPAWDPGLLPRHERQWVGSCERIKYQDTA